MDRIRVKGPLGLTIEGTEEDPLRVTYKKENTTSDAVGRKDAVDGKPSKRKSRVSSKSTKDGLPRE